VLKLVEDKANGPAVMNALALQLSGLVPITPTSSKVARAAAVSPFVEGRQVWLPAPKLAPWVGGLITEAAQFPQSPNDDRVDALTQALDRLLLDPLLTDDDIVEDDEDGPPEGSISLY
jgi:predicted phage terminase large subunit-like protein